MNRSATVLLCLIAFLLSSAALCVALTMLNNRGLGFGFTPLCVAPAFAVAAILGIKLKKGSESMRWIIVPTIAASGVLLWMANFIFGEYRKHGQQTVGGGGGVAVLILLGLGAVLVIIYAPFVMGLFLRPTKNEKRG